MINKLQLHNYKTLQSTPAEYVFTSDMDTLTKIKHMLNYKANLHQCERSKPLKNMLRDCSNRKL